MGAFIDLTGNRYGRPLLTGRAGTRNKRVFWNYICDCGSIGTVAGVAVRHSEQRSCGCLQREAAARIGRSRATHGHARKGKRSPTYQSYSAMLGRTTCPTHHAWANYGGRGIQVCDRWRFGAGDQSGFDCFLADMGERPAGTSIDRIDNSKSYEPSNCRWTIDAVQVRNRRTVTMKVESVQRLRELARTKEASIPDLASRFGISRAQAYRIVQGTRWAA